MTVSDFERAVALTLVSFASRYQFAFTRPEVFGTSGGVSAKFMGVRKHDR